MEDPVFIVTYVTDYGIDKDNDYKKSYDLDYMREFVTRLRQEPNVSNINLYFSQPMPLEDENKKPSVDEESTAQKELDDLKKRLKSLFKYIDIQDISTRIEYANDENYNDITSLISEYEKDETTQYVEISGSIKCSLKDVTDLLANGAVVAVKCGDKIHTFNSTDINIEALKE